MKKLIIAALLVVSVSVFSQESTAKKIKSERGAKQMKSPEDRSEARLKALTKELNLDANQQVQMKEVIAEQASKMEAMKAERMDNADIAKLTKEERKARKAKRDEENVAMNNRLKVILNPTQLEKYNEIEAAKKAKMQERGKQNAPQ